MYVDWQFIGGICLSSWPIGPIGGASWGVGVLVASLITVDGVEVTFLKLLLMVFSSCLKLMTVIDDHVESANNAKYILTLTIRTMMMMMLMTNFKMAII